MMRDRVQSDQLERWSDSNARETFSGSPEKKKSAPAETPFARGRVAGLADRALQAVRQARMQMRGGARPWAQVLLVHQSDGRQAGNGLHSPRSPSAGRGVSDELPEDKGNSRGTLCNKPRTAAAQGTFLGDPHACLPGERDSSAPLRHRGDGNSPCQYARRSGALRRAGTRGEGGNP